MWFGFWPFTWLVGAAIFFYFGLGLESTFFRKWTHGAFTYCSDCNWSKPFVISCCSLQWFHYVSLTIWFVFSKLRQWYGHSFVGPSHVVQCSGQGRPCGVFAIWLNLGFPPGFFPQITSIVFVPRSCSERDRAAQRFIQENHPTPKQQLDKQEMFWFKTYEIYYILAPLSLENPWDIFTLAKGKNGYLSQRQDSPSAEGRVGGWSIYIHKMR